jgi:putative serine/threonine protein kinase
MEFLGVRLLGKGQNSYVFICKLGNLNNEYACKIRRPDASRPELAREGLLMRLANSVGVGPHVINYTSNIIVMELIKGVPMSEYVWSTSPSELRSVIRDLLLQCRRLDSIGLMHNELSRVEDHIIITEDKPYIIDFESATVGSRGSNVSQIINALIMGKSQVQAKIRSVLNPEADLNELRGLVRDYKVRRDDESFLRILSSLGL